MARTSSAEGFVPDRVSAELDEQQEAALQVRILRDRVPVGTTLLSVGGWTTALTKAMTHVAAALLMPSAATRAAAVLFSLFVYDWQPLWSMCC